MFEIFKKSKLIIFTYFHATGFNQCMALNKPCIAFTPNASKIILKNIINYGGIYTKLESFLEL